MCETNHRPRCKYTAEVTDSVKNLVRDDGGDGLACKEPCCQAWGPELNSLSAHSENIEQTPTNCPLINTHEPHS